MQKYSIMELGFYVLLRKLLYFCKIYSKNVWQIIFLERIMNFPENSLEKRIFIVRFVS